MPTESVLERPLRTELYSPFRGGVRPLTLPFAMFAGAVCYARNTSTPVIWDGGIFSTSSTSWRVGDCGRSPDTWIRSNPTPTSFRPLQEPCTHCHDRCSA